MDRRYLVAFLLFAAVLFAYPYYLRLIGITPSTENGYRNEEVRPESEEAPPEPQETKEPVQAKTFPFRSGAYDILFTDRGGSIFSLAHRGVSLYNGEARGAGIFALKILHEEEDLSQALFGTKREGGRDTGPAFVFEKEREYRIEKRFFVGGEKPILVLETEVVNLSDRMRHFPLILEYALDLPTETRYEEASEKTVRFAGGEFRATGVASLRKKPYSGADSVEWVGLLRKYYCFLVKTDTKIIAESTRVEERRIVSEARLAPLAVKPHERAHTRILIYAGPQRFEDLKEFGFGKVISHGALGFLRVALIRTLSFCHQLVQNYGVAILLLTLLIKLIFTPLTHMSYESMRKMQALQPKIRALQKQHEKDPARMNKELMGLYRRNRVHPIGGCLPLFLQIPIFIAFYQVLSEDYDLKGAPFVGWIKDLSVPDRLFTFPFSLPVLGDSFNPLPLLMIGSMLWQQKLTPQSAPVLGQGQEKIMYLMPIIFGFLFYNLPSGLVLYWLTSNLLTIFHQLVIKRIPVILHHEDS